MISAPARRPMTLTQKILAAHARNLPRPWVEVGDVLQIGVDWTIASELAWNGMERTYSMLGRPRLHDKERFFLAVDHTVDPVTLATDKRAQKLVQLSQNFARESGIRHFYDANQTILHTKFYRDLVRPNDVVLGADSHTSSHGGLGAVSIGLGGADIVVAMVLGTSWIEVPEAISVEYSGQLPFGFGGKEVILRTLALLGRNTVAMERSVEYRGEGVRQLSTDSRFAIANMTAEFGGLNGIFEADEVTAAWLAGRADEDDPAALHPIRARRAGLWEVYERSGFRIGPPGCSMCLGVASEKAGRGEKWLSSQNRNYENRMGEGSLAHLASAATVAASAAEMKVTDPRPLLAQIDQDRYRRILGERKPRRVPEVQVTEPKPHLAPAGATARPASSGKAARAAARGAAQGRVVGARIQRFGDNVDTDDIIPGEFCHLTSLAELGAKAFHYVRPEFVQRAREGATVIVAGEGWGSGSSREQAVLALKGAGIEAIVAKSYAFIHKRNLVNEALPFLVVHDDAFYEVAKEGADIEVDLARGCVHLAGKEFQAEEPSRIIQALAGEGGIVPAIQHHGTTVFEKLTA